MEMKNENIRIRVERSFVSDSYRLYMTNVVDKEFYAANEIILSPTAEGLTIPSFAEINSTTAMELMDELWSAGVRPSRGNWNNETINAKDEHLQDMRKIAFNKLGVEI